MKGKEDKTIERDVNKLLDYLKQQGVEIDQDVEKIINFFNGKVLVRFSPAGFGGGVRSSFSTQLSKKTGAEEQKAQMIMWKLEKLNLLGEEKGMHGLSGAEYEYGFTPHAESIMKKIKKKK